MLLCLGLVSAAIASWGTACVTVVLLLVALTLIVPLCLILAIPKMIQEFPSDPTKQKENYDKFRGKIAAISQPKTCA